MRSRLNRPGRFFIVLFCSYFLKNFVAASNSRLCSSATFDGDLSIAAEGLEERWFVFTEQTLVSRRLTSLSFSLLSALGCFQHHLHHLSVGQRSLLARLEAMSRFSALQMVIDEDFFVAVADVPAHPSRRRLQMFLPSA